MNFASSVFRDRNPASTAIIEASEGSLVTTSISWGELYSRVEKNADALRALGICAGDRVAAVVANHSYSITLCLAALSLGAIWSSVSPDFGVRISIFRVE
jgi:acetoacetyl-CoA synthetase